MARIDSLLPVFLFKRKTLALRGGRDQPNGERPVAVAAVYSIVLQLTAQMHPVT
jgi:hypothetical protein